MVESVFRFLPALLHLSLPHPIYHCTTIWPLTVTPELGGILIPASPTPSSHGCTTTPNRSRSSPRHQSWRGRRTPLSLRRVYGGGILVPLSGQAGSVKALRVPNSMKTRFDRSGNNALNIDFEFVVGNIAPFVCQMPPNHTDCQRTVKKLLSKSTGTFDEEPLCDTVHKNEQKPKGRDRQNEETKNRSPGRRVTEAKQRPSLQTGIQKASFHSLKGENTTIDAPSKMTWSTLKPLKRIENQVAAAPILSSSRLPHRHPRRYFKLEIRIISSPGKNKTKSKHYWNLNVLGESNPRTFPAALQAGERHEREESKQSIRLGGI
ncbi:hypothetical protein FB45DRAFT_876092 [Roridomyces roridus]|uniref:Uncharacterized protein n=1 Tax=Roridomyces roridus TaxID=1738132 RepID=A0AAD7B3X7_9AGAR|nr:hypothetical protein FB45DRAFT_876092 [Roridomyces roridus]